MQTKWSQINLLLEEQSDQGLSAYHITHLMSHDFLTEKKKTTTTNSKTNPDSKELYFSWYRISYDMNMASSHPDSQQLPLTYASGSSPSLRVSSTKMGSICKVKK